MTANMTEFIKVAELDEIDEGELLGLEVDEARLETKATQSPAPKMLSPLQS